MCLFCLLFLSYHHFVKVDFAKGYNKKAQKRLKRKYNMRIFMCNLMLSGTFDIIEINYKSSN